MTDQVRVNQGKDGKFLPGNLANPKGRPPGLYARDLARTHTDKAIDRLVRALDEPRNAVQAAVALLDRGWGKPREQHENFNLNVEMGGGIDGPPLPETLDEWLRRRRAQLEQQLSGQT